MAWDYAELSKAAKAAGGPEALAEMLVQSGKEQMVPWIAGIGVAGLGIGYGISKLVGYFKKKKISKQEVEAAKKELIQGIKQYDAEHLTETDIVME